MLCLLRCSLLRGGRLEALVLDAGGEAGTALGYAGQLAVADDAGLGVIVAQIGQQFVERAFLWLGAGVGRLTLRIETALIADAERTVVVASGMNALYGLRQDRDDLAAATHIVVVAWLSEARHARVDKGINTERAVAPCGGAVNYQHGHGIVAEGL